MSLATKISLGDVSHYLKHPLVIKTTEIGFTYKWIIFIIRKAEKIEKITVDKDVFDFLKYVYFKSLSNCYEATSRRAYLDMCRTIRFNKKNGDETRKKAEVLIEKEIKALIKTGVDSQAEYDAWHFELCRQIKQLYDDQNIDFYMGQSQKWVTMTMK